MLIVNNRWLNLGNLEAGTVHKVEQAVACAEYARGERVGSLVSRP